MTSVALPGVEPQLAPAPAGAGRFLIAFDSPTLAPAPPWTRIDSFPNLVTSYQIDRGRSYELDRTDVGRATVQIADPDGILDPTNSAGPFFGKIEPLLQATISRFNPVDGTWYTRYRGFIEEMDYQVDPSQLVNRLTITLVDIFEILNAAQMWPGEFGDPPPLGSEGQVFFDNANMDDRILQALGNAGIPVELQVIFSGNVALYEQVYSPGESAMAVIQEAADAEWPGLSNVYVDRFGRLAVHGRGAKFSPASVSSGAGDDAWDYHHWHAGDGAAFDAEPATIVQLRELAVNRGLARIINTALATPIGIDDADVAAQVVKDDASIDRYGIRPWEAQNLLTKRGLIDGSDALTETKRFAQFYVANFSQPRSRITSLKFRSLRPDDRRGPNLWALLSKIDVSDMLDATVTFAGGGGLDHEQYFVEGIHETVTPLNPDYDNVELSVDLSPQAYFAIDPWPS